VRKAIEAYDVGELLNVFETGRGEACGGGPVAAVMSAARRLGSREIKFLEHTTSGEVTGDFSEVVGYLSAVMLMGEKAQTDLAEKKRSAEAVGAIAAKKPDAKLPESAKQRLHQIAREAIAAYLEGRDYTPEPTPELDMTRGAFVTLKIGGQLRGCIGQIRAREKLYQLIASMAVAAAFDDPRFPRLTPDEYDRLEYEISVLTPLQRVKDISEIKVGRDGLMIKLDLHSGLLLPQVATEYGWDARTFVEQTCLKAGLPKESYKDKYAEIYRFAAEVF
jgi:AmmeMemoRadiSam system protein A